MIIQETQCFSPMEGFILIDSIFHLRNIEELPELLLGNLDVKIKSAFFFLEHMREAASLDELNSCTVSQQSLDNLKNMVRGHLQMAANQAARREERNEFHRKQKAKKNAARSFKAQHKASDLGTVSEIAEKYGLSKKKVRELKRDGQLEEYIQSL